MGEYRRRLVGVPSITTEAEYDAGLARLDAIWNDDAASDEADALAAALEAYEKAQGWHDVLPADVTPAARAAAPTPPGR